MAQTAILSLQVQTSAARLASQSGTIFGADATLRRPAESFRQRYKPVTARAEKENNTTLARTTRAATLSMVAAASLPGPAMAVDTETVTSVLSQVSIASTPSPLIDLV